MKFDGKEQVDISALIDACKRDMEDAVGADDVGQRALRVALDYLQRGYQAGLNDSLWKLQQEMSGLEVDPEIVG